MGEGLSRSLKSSAVAREGAGKTRSSNSSPHLHEIHSLDQYQLVVSLSPGQLVKRLSAEVTVLEKTSIGYVHVPPLRTTCLCTNTTQLWGQHYGSTIREAFPDKKPAPFPSAYLWYHFYPTFLSHSRSRGHVWSWRQFGYKLGLIWTSCVKSLTVIFPTLVISLQNCKKWGRVSWLGSMK